VGETVQVLVEEVEDGVVGRAAHQGPEVDGQVQLQTGGTTLAVGDLVTAVVVASEGADLVADLVLSDEVSRKVGSRA
jgi:ribosomal protein S12 methylthiotransferase